MSSCYVVAEHVAQALTRVRAIDEVRQRNAELAIINDVGSALAKQLDFDAIVELVGERLWGIFGSKANDLYIALVDSASELVEGPVRDRRQ